MANTYHYYWDSDAKTAKRCGAEVLLKSTWTYSPSGKTVYYFKDKETKREVTEEMKQELQLFKTHLLLMGLTLKEQK